MIIITATTDKGMILPLGRQDEKNARQVWFDLTWLIENFGEGTAELKYQRSEDGAPYLVNTTRVSNQLIWTVSRTDVAFDGFGKAEIVWTVTGADTEAKTVIYKTNVLASLATETEVPDPYESWYDKMMESIGDSQGYAEQAAQSAQDAETAASTAAVDAANAVRTELSGLAQQAAQSATNASNSADRAETAAESIESASVVLTASSAGSGIVTINASLNRG